ncbi:hypothetical protein B0H11DRAFT_2066500 [Mycena galericulata]|nr:hypothetical protein B0H11DRAFT_2066500 [Mycena galericulata]
MRYSTPASLLLLAAVAHAAPNARRQAVQCAATDKGGTPLTSSEGTGNFVTCIYGASGGAGQCTYFPANGSFSSGSSQCPAGVPQNPSATTDALSSVGGGGSAPTSTTPPNTDPFTSAPTTTPSVSTLTPTLASTPVNTDPFTSAPSASNPGGPIATTTPTAPGTGNSAPVVPSVSSGSASPSGSGKSNAAMSVRAPGAGARSYAQLAVVGAALAMGAFVL